MERSSYAHLGGGTRVDDRGFGFERAHAVSVLLGNDEDEDVHEAVLRDPSAGQAPSANEAQLRLRRILSHCALVVVGCAFGGMNVLAQVGISTPNDISVLDKVAVATLFAWYRLAFACPVLLVAALFIEGTAPWRVLWSNLRRDILLYVLAGFIGIFMNQFFFFIGISFAGADLASIFQPLTPVFTACFAVVAGLEPFSLLRFSGVAVAVIGVLGVVFLRRSSSNGDADAASTASSGDLAAGYCGLLLNTAGAAMLVLLQKPLLRRYPPIFVTFSNVFVGMICTSIPAAYFAVESPSYCGIARKEWPALIYTVLVATCFNYALMSWANNYLDGTVVNLYQMLQPPSTVLLAWVFLPSHPVVPWTTVLSGVFILLGLILSSAGGGSKLTEGADDESGTEEKRRGLLTDSGPHDTPSRSPSEMSCPASDAT
jgi:drug/metabolite transporter (DMT)-like permease